MKKRIISFATGLALMSSIITPIASLADEETTAVFSYETYSVLYEIKSSWDNNQIIEITLTNTGDEPILNWALNYDAEGEINGIWNSELYDSNETEYVIRNSGFNYEILPQQSVTFGYTLSGDDLCVPESISLCSQRKECSIDDYSVSLSVSNDWGTGFTGTVTVQNLSDIPIEAWKLGFDANFEISSVWNAQMLSSDYNSYSLCSDITTTPISAGETKTFGFAASKSTDVSPELSDIVLSQVVIDADLSDSGSSDDSSDESSENSDDSSSEYVDDSSSTTDDSSDVDSNDENSESDSSDESSEYEEPVIRPQTYTYEVRNEECAVDEITISMETSGDLEHTTTAQSIMDKDVMCSGVVGLFGEPFDIETSAEFTNAVLTFKVDKSMLGDTEFDNLLFLWYDEENENFVELDTEHDEENSTVSTTVTHFSKYMLVDGLAWYTNWQMISKEMVDNGLVGEQSLLSKPSVAIGIPTVYSDSSSDPVTVNKDGSISCKRIDAFRYIYESLSPGQNYSLNFSIYGSDGYIHAKRLYCDELENDGLVDKYLNDLGFEDWEERSDFFLPHLALYTYADYNNTHFDVAIIIISDDYQLDDMYTGFFNSAHDNRFVFIDMRDVTDHYLINRAEATGGLYMKYSNHAMNYLRKILRGEARFEDYDNDGDGFSDLEEKRGLIYDQAGNKVKTYWQFEDTDNDELDDNEEVDVELTTVSIPGKCGNPDTIKFFHKMHSRPDLADSDGDNIGDAIDIEPMSPNTINVFSGDCYDLVDKYYTKLLEYKGQYMVSGDCVFGSMDSAERICYRLTLDLMMKWVNACPRPDLVPDEDWLAFCKKFNSIIISYYKTFSYGELTYAKDVGVSIIDKELHYFRLKLNRAPATLDEMIVLIKSADKDDKWELYDLDKTLYHMFENDGEYNLKFGSSKNTDYMFEAVYNKDGVLLTEYNSNINMCTYNYCSDQEDSDVHYYLDVLPYKNYGNTPDESSRYLGDNAKRENKERFNNNEDAQSHRAKIEKELQ